MPDLGHLEGAVVGEQSLIQLLIHEYEHHVLELPVGWQDLAQWGVMALEERARVLILVLKGEFEYFVLKHFVGRHLKGQVEEAVR